MFTDEKAGVPAPWQWPGLWSLNLPVLVIVWQILFARSFNVWLGGYHLATAAALAWTFLATERWIFFFRMRRGISGEPLPQDMAEQGASMARIFLLVLAGLILVAVFRANVREVGGMLIWSSLGGLYLTGLRLRPAQMGEILPREMALPVYLAGTAVLFVWANSAFAPMQVMLPGLLLLLLLFYYTSLIATWAKPYVPTPPGGVLFESELALPFRVVPIGLILAGAVLALVTPAVASDQLLLTIGVSGVILLMLDFWQNSMPKAAARILADVALLTPIVPLLIGW